MMVGEGVKRMKLKFEIVEVHFNFTSHDSVYFKKLVINFNFPAWAHIPPIDPKTQYVTILSPPQDKSFFFFGPS